MKAAVCERYGPPEVVQVKDVPMPSPRDDEILVKIRATTVSAGDWRVRSLSVPVGLGIPSRLMLGLWRPRQPILGTELAGDVALMGGNVTRFKPGERVFAFPRSASGCHAQYRCVSQDDAIIAKPEGLSYEEAASLSFGGTTALHFLRRAKLEDGERVLVNGASGAVGVAAVQLAKQLGAHVTGVCSTANVDLVRSLGADRVADYTREDFADDEKGFDVIVETVGTAPWARSKKALRKGGRLLLVMGTLPGMLQAPWISMVTDKKVIAGVASGTADDLRYLAQLAKTGKVKPVIERRYPLEEIVEAHRHVATGRKRGSVVITVAHSD